MDKNKIKTIVSVSSFFHVQPYGACALTSPVPAGVDMANGN